MQVNSNSVISAFIESMRLLGVEKNEFTIILETIYGNVTTSPPAAIYQQDVPLQGAKTLRDITIQMLRGLTNTDLLRVVADFHLYNQIAHYGSQDQQVFEFSRIIDSTVAPTSWHGLASHLCEKFSSTNVERVLRPLL